MLMSRLICRGWQYHLQSYIKHVPTCSNHATWFKHIQTMNQRDLWITSLLKILPGCLAHTALVQWFLGWSRVGEGHPLAPRQIAKKSGQISQCDPCRATFVQLDLQGEPPHSHNLWMVKRCHKSSTGTIFVPTFLQNPWRSKIAFQIQNPRKITSVPEVKVQQQKLC